MMPLKNSNWTSADETWSIFFIETWIQILTHNPYTRHSRSTHGSSQLKAQVHFLVLQLEPYKLFLYKWLTQKQRTKSDTEIRHWIKRISAMKGANEGSYCQDTMLQKGNSPWSWCRPTRNLRKHLGVRVQLNQSHQNYIQKINHIAYWICQLCEMEITHKSHWSTATARDLGSETAWRERQTHSRIEDPYGFSGLDAVLWTTAERSDHHSLVLASASQLWRYCNSVPEPFKTKKEQESNLDH